MRPHVEFVHEDDYVMRPAELPCGRGEAVQRNLSVDEEDGSASLRVDFRTEFSRPAGRHAADTEWFVLEGKVGVGERRLGPGGYLYAPRETSVPAVRAAAGTRILLFHEGGDGSFAPDGSRSGGAGSPIILDANALPWQESDKPGIRLKILLQRPGVGHVTALSVVEPGWREERYTHHETWEECYTLAGGTVYNFGELVPGTYFFRPPGIKHGEFLVDQRQGCSWFLRWEGDADLVSFYTLDPGVKVLGTPENYDPQREGPTLAGVPVRSRHAGPWDGTGR